MIHWYRTRTHNTVLNFHVILNSDSDCHSTLNSQIQYIVTCTVNQDRVVIS